MKVKAVVMVAQAFFVLMTFCSMFALIIGIGVMTGAI